MHIKISGISLFFPFKLHSVMAPALRHLYLFFLMRLLRGTYTDYLDPMEGRGLFLSKVFIS